MGTAVRITAARLANIYARTVVVAIGMRPMVALAHIALVRRRRHTIRGNRNVGRRRSGVVRRIRRRRRDVALHARLGHHGAGRQQGAHNGSADELTGFHGDLLSVDIDSQDFAAHVPERGVMQQFVELVTSLPNLPILRNIWRRHRDALPTDCVRTVGAVPARSRVLTGSAQR